MARGSTAPVLLGLNLRCPEDLTAENVTVMLADPDLAACIIDKCSALTWCQSTWAGNAPLLNADKEDYVLTGLKGIFGKLMREYVFAYLLQHARNTKFLHSSCIVVHTIEVKSMDIFRLNSCVRVMKFL